MFAKWKRPKEIRMITLLDQEGAIRQRMPFAQFELPEDVVLALSIRFYHDPAPCHIHRSAVQQRALAEIEAACPPGEAHRLSSLPDDMQLYFDKYPGTDALRISLELP